MYLLRGYKLMRVRGGCKGFVTYAKLVFLHAMQMTKELIDLSFASNA